MTVLRLGPDEAGFLASHYEESAMGYQILESAFARWNRTLFLALNSEFLVPFATLAELRRELHAISSWTEETLRHRSESVRLAEEPVPSADRLGLALAVSLLNPTVALSRRVAKVVTPQEITARRVVHQAALYFRFSAFRSDRRVMPDGSFVAGTYATTFNDLRMVPSGFAAVGRYALPSSLSARYVTPIVTDASPIYVGTATPNFGQAGGGVEVLFTKGARHLPGVSHEGPED